MPELSGLQRVVVSGSLWLVLAFPLLGALYLVWFARRAEPGAHGDEAMRAARRAATTAGVGAIALALGATLFETWVLATSRDDAHTLICHFWRIIRVGQIDVNADLAFDPFTAVVCLLV